MNQNIFSIGKALDNDLVFKNPHISRYHCQLVRKLDGLFIEDLDSTNGIYVAGKKVTTAKIDSSSVIVLGGVERLNLSDQKITKWLNGSKEGANSSRSDFNSVSSVYDLDSYSKNQVTFGRDPSNDVVLTHPRISRHHATAEKNSDGTWTLNDFSANGIFINGKRIKQERLTAGSSVVFAGLPISLVSSSSGVELPVSNEMQRAGEALIEVENTTFSVPDGAGRKTILSDLSLRIQPGEFVGLIGPSGSGKTTFMLTLNGYNQPSSGRISINHINLHQQLDSFKGFIGYVPQDDIMHRELTVESNLLYNAELRLPDLDDNERRRQVLKVINELGLEKTRNVLIGTPEKKGISGGQRKRVNLALELITEPSFLLLDEPCSGLDPKSEKDVMIMLRKLSRSGKTVMITTHGIMDRNFKLLDKLIVLGEGGHLTYFGPSMEAIKFFGVAAPEDIFDALKEKGTSYWHNTYRNSSYFKSFAHASNRGNTSSLVSPKPTKHNMLKQLVVLCKRYSEIKWRDKLLSAMLLAQAPLIGLLLLMVATYSNQSYPIWTFLLVISSLWLGVSNAAREIVSERAIYKRESMVFLSPGNYLLSKFIVLSVIEAVQCLLLLLICYNACNLSGNFLHIYFLLLFVSIAGTALGLLISSASSSEAQAMALVPMFLIPQVILGGAIVQFTDIIPKIPAFTMLSRWGWEAAMLLETAKVNTLEATQQLSYFNLKDGNIPLDLTIIGGWMLIYIGITVYNLVKVNK